MAIPEWQLELNREFAELNEALAQDPNNVAALKQRAKFYTRRSNPKFNPSLAIEDLGRVLELDPSDWESWVSRGAERCQLGDVEAGLADLKQALEVCPESVRNVPLHWISLHDAASAVDPVAKLAEQVKEARELDDYPLDTYRAHMRELGSMLAGRSDQPVELARIAMDIMDGHGLYPDDPAPVPIAVRVFAAALQRSFKHVSPEEQVRLRDAMEVLKTRAKAARKEMAEGTEPHRELGEAIRYKLRLPKVKA